MIDKLYKYKMDPASIGEDTEWTCFSLQVYKQTERRTKWNQQYLPPGIIKYVRNQVARFADTYSIPHSSHLVK